MVELIIKQLPVGPMANFAYLVGDAATNVAAAIDPGWGPDEILHAALAANLKIEKILLTHTHFDHSQALSELVELAHAPVYVQKEEAHEIAKGIETIETVDGTIIDVGNLKIECLSTPGHTKGSQCFLVDGALFTGDTLFIDGCGRVDLPGSDPKEMVCSLARIAKLDGNITIYPGHDYGPKNKATIAEQLKTNPYLGRISEAALL